MENNLIHGYNGVYRIDIEGVVINTIRNTIISQYYDKGYKKLLLGKGGVRTHYFIHRLVAQTFIPNPDNKPCVNHINGIKDDNRVENLEWCTHSENIFHAINILGKNIGKPGKRKNTKKVRQYSIEGEFIREYRCVFDAKNELKINNIDKCLKGRCNISGGFIWKYS